MTNPTQTSTVETSRSRQTVYNSLMQVPHRDYDQLVPSLRQAMLLDPDFVARACAYIAQNSAIRDQVDCAIISLLQSDPLYPEYREAGRCLLLGGQVAKTVPDGIPGIPPFRIFRIEKYIRASATKAPRLMRGAVKDYLRWLEADDLRFDGVAIRNRAALQNAYVHYHIQPSPRAQAILFDNKPPADSKLAVLKQIVNEADVRKQAAMIAESHIPYVVAASLVSKDDPIISLALIEVMTPTEALNSRAWIERSGLLQNLQIREAYTAKVKRATGSIASADHRKSAQGTDKGVQVAVEAAKEKAVKQAKRISGQVDIYLDVSGSMENVIQNAPAFAERIYPQCDDVALIVHNDVARIVIVGETGNPLNDVRTALRGVRAGGGTLHSAALARSLDSGRMPEKIVLLTDGGENREGLFAATVERYERQAGITPHIVMIHFAGQNRDVLTDSLQEKGYHIDRFEFTGDYYVFDQAVAVLGGPAGKSMVDKIMETELPHRV